MNTAPLSEIVRIVSGATPKTGTSEFWDGDVLWATPSDLSKLEGPYIDKTLRSLTAAGVRSCAATVLPSGSVLLSSRAPIGHVAINTVPMATNQGFKSLVPGPDIDAKYLYYWLKSQTNYLQSLGNGATFKELSTKTTEKIRIPLPTLPEQRRVAAILDSADALRAKRRRLLTHLEALELSIFDDMFGESSGKRRVDMSELVSVVTKGTTPTTVGLKFTDSGVPFLRAQNLLRGTVGFSEKDLHIGQDTHHQLRRSWVLPRDLLISIAGTIGRVSLVPPDAPVMNCNQAVAILRLVEPNIGPWLRAWLNTNDALSQVGASAVTATISNLSLGQIRKLKVPHVPKTDIESFVQKSHCLDNAKTLIANSIALDNSLFASLQSRAFRGEPFN